jgi:hypothetical protein
MKEVENESRKMGLDILNKINAVADAQYPVGYVYTQYPGTSDPATLFGGTWLNITSLYAGLFFRAEGGAALAFNGGNQADAIITHRHALGVSGAGSFAFGSTTITSSSVMTLAGAGTNGPNTGDPLTVATASETRPVNTTIRIWQRTGGTLTTTAGTSVTSGIYDSGTNSNGSWIRFTDGTMQCWGSNSVTTSVSFANGFGSTAGNEFYGTLDGVTFPQTFTVAPSVNINCNDNGAFQVMSAALVTTTNFRAIGSYRLNSTVMDFNWHAIGKWK